MNSQVLHSFVIPAFGASPYLERCIQSLLDQSTPSEIIVCTSTPNDMLRELCERYGLSLFVNPGGGSIAADWNFAYSTARTPYLTLAHQDDVYDSMYTEQCLGAAQRWPACTLVFCDYAEIIHSEGAERIRKHNLILSVKRCILWCFFGFGQAMRRRWRKYWLLAFGSPISCPTVLFHKAQLHNFSFDESYVVNLDWDAWRRLALEPGRFVYLRQQLVLHRIYADSATSRGLHTQDRQREDARIFAIFWPKALSRVFAWLYASSYRSNSSTIAGDR